MTTNNEFMAPEDTSSADNKKKIIAAGVLGALVLGYGGYTLLSGGDSSSPQAFVPIKRAPITKAKVVPAKAKKAPAKTASVPAASTVKLGRDPFLALYRVPVAAAPGTSDSTTTPVTTTAGTSTGTSGGSTTPTSSPYALKLTSIKGTDAKLYTFSVAGTAKTVVAAQKFGKYGELVVLAYIKDAKGNPIGALLQVGDDDPVGVKVGEKITVL